jgi:hypothetical protein
MLTETARPIHNVSFVRLRRGAQDAFWRGVLANGILNSESESPKSAGGRKETHITQKGGNIRCIIVYHEFKRQQKEGLRVAVCRPEKLANQHRQEA